MGQVLHRSATTTGAIRRAIQDIQESLRALARRHGINPKTVAKWRKRDSTADRRTGPTVPKSTVLSVEQEAIISSSHFASTRSCRSTTASTPCRPRSPN
jgi:transposase-like protein